MHQEKMKRIISAVLCVAMLLGNVPVSGHAHETDEKLCAHHVSHEGCGYEEGVTPCGYVCDQCELEKQATDPEETTPPVTEAPKPVCTGLADCAAEEHSEGCEKAAADAKAAAEEAARKAEEEAARKAAEEKAAADKAAADAVAALIVALPTLEAVRAKPLAEAGPEYTQVNAAYDAWKALTDDQKVLLDYDQTFFDPYLLYFSGQTQEAAVTSGSCGDGSAAVTWMLDNGILTISGTGRMYDYASVSALGSVDYVSQPWNVDGINKLIVQNGVTRVGGGVLYRLQGNHTVTEVEIADGVKQIGDYAFYSCYNLPSITIPKSVTYIGYAVFEDCSSLTSVTFKGDAPSLEANTFKNVRATCYYPAGNATWADTINQNYGGTINWVAYNPCAGGHSFTGGKCTACGIIGGYCGSPNNTDIVWTLDDAKKLTLSGTGAMKDYFYSSYSGPVVPWENYKKQVTAIEIGEGITYIGDFAFNWCSHVEEVTIPASVTSIGTGIFFFCGGLERINVASGNTAFASVDGVLFSANKATLVAFPASKSDTSYTIPNTVTTVADYAFYRCSNLTAIQFGNNVTTIGDSAFCDCSGLTAVTVPSTVTSLGSSAFSGCSSLVSATVPGSIGALPFHAFYDCSSLKNVTLGQGLTAIGPYAFYSCRSLQSIVIPEGPTVIGKEAFKECKSLILIVIPSSVTDIKDAAFYDCNKLNHVLCTGAVPNIGDSNNAVKYDATKHSGVAGTEAVLNSDGTVTCSLCALTAVSISAAPTKKYYARNENLDVTGGKLQLTYGSGTNKTVDITAAMVTGFDSTSLGTKTLTVSYEGKTATFTVTVAVPVDETTFPNANFRSYIMTSVTGAADGWLTAVELANVTSISGLNGMNIADLTGVEYFTNLTSLYCYGNKLTELDVSKNTKLEELHCYNNQLTELDVSKNTALGYLDCHGNGLTALNISKNTALKKLFCEENSLTALDISENLLLEEVYCYNNQLTALDISKNTALEQLNCKNNKLVVLDTTNNTNLNSLDCSNNCLTSLAYNNAYQYWTPTCTGNAYTITVKYNQFDLKNLPGNFDASKIGSCSGGEVNGTILTVSSDTVTYSYRIYYKQHGSGAITDIKDVRFKLNVQGFLCTHENMTAGTCKTPAKCNNCDYVGEVNPNQHTWSNDICSECRMVKNAWGNCGDLTINGGNDVKWTMYANGDLVITGTGPMRDYSSMSGTAPWQEGFGKDDDGEHYIFVEDVQIGDGITRLGNYAFYDCDDMVSITIPDSVTSIGTGVFNNCYDLTGVVLPDAITSIPSYAFSGCSRLSAFEIPDAVTSIGNSAFAGSGLTGIEISEKITSIGNSVFSGCKKLTAITVSDSNAYFASEDGVVFSKDKATLKIYPGGKTGTYTIPAHVTAIEAYAFENSSLTGIVFHDNLSIGYYAFRDCTALTEVKLPAVTSIPDGMFCQCSRLAKIMIPVTVKTIGVSAFSDITFPEVYYGGNQAQWDAINIGEDNDQLKKPKKLYLNAAGTSGDVSYTFFDGVLTIYGNGAMADYESGKAPWYAYRLSTNYSTPIKSIIVEDGVTTIGKNAFMDCELVESVSIGKDVKSIGENAFRYCNLNLKEILLPDGLKTIGKQAFYSCSGLTEMTIPASVETIGDEAFRHCNGLKTLHFEGNAPSLGKIFYGQSAVTAYYPANSDGWDEVIGKDYTAEGANTTCVVTWIATCGQTHVYDESLIAYAWKQDFSKCTASLVCTNKGCQVAQTKTVTPTSQVITAATCGASGLAVYTATFASPFETQTKEGTIPATGEHNFAEVVKDEYRVSAATCQSAAVYKKSCTVCGAESDVTFTTGELADHNRDANHKCGTCGHIGGYCGDPNVNGGKNVSWTLDKTTGKMTISGSGAMKNYTPDTYTNLPGTPWLKKYSTDIKTVEVQNGVTTIGDYLFYYCNRVATVNLPEGITYIGEYAFAGTDLTSIELSDGLLTIGRFAFASTELTSITLPESVTTVKQYAFGYCAKLTEIIMPSTLTEIQDKVFQGCTALEKVVLPEGITKIWDSLFMNCSSLTEVAIPRSVTGVNLNAFKNCTALADVYYAGDSNAWIALGDNRPVGENLRVHYECTNSQSHWAPKTVDATCTEDGYTAEVCKCAMPYERNKVVDPATGEHSFAEVVKDEYRVSAATCQSAAVYKKSCTVCGAESDVTFTDGELADHNRDANHKCGTCGHIGGYCGQQVTWEFNEITGMLTISGIGEMEDFESDTVPWDSYKTKIKEVAINEGVTTIGQSAFEECGSISKVSLPSTLTSIGKWAFSGCTRLSGVEIPSGVTKIGAAAFAQTQIQSITIPAGVTEIPGSLFYVCRSLKTVTILGDVTSIGNGAFGYCESLESIDIPDTVTCIEKYAFRNCKKLKEIEIPQAVQTIGAYAFMSCSALEKVTLPEGITIIGERVFDACTSLTKINIPNTVETIDYGAFWGCNKLAEVVLPNGLKTIGKWAFSACAITNIEIPETVKVIYAEVFAHSDEPVSIKFLGNAPALNSTAFKNTTVTAYYPRTATGWTEEKMHNYGGTDVKWVMYCPNDEHAFGNVVKEAFKVSDANCTAPAEYSKSCICGAVSKTETFTDGDMLGHTGGTATCKDLAICDRCKQPHGNLDATNHVGGTETRDAKSATCTVDGYTGDTWCLGCQTKIADGETIGAPGHKYDQQKVDENNLASAATCTAQAEYYMSCACGEKGTTTFKYGDSLGHTGGTATCKDLAICDRCKQPHGNLDATNHVGGTETRDAKSATCTVDGYTGDTWCLGCQTKIADGETIGAPGHKYDQQKVDENNLASAATCTAQAEYYMSCACGEKGTTTFKYGESLGHTGGMATCKDLAICDRCKQPHGNLDATNHVGGTEIRDAKSATCTVDGYTGDTWCLGCQTKIADGETIGAPGHKHEAVVTPPTCMGQGYTTYTCHCGDSYVGDYVTANGHSMGEWYTVREATPDADGEIRRDCGACDSYETQSVPYQGGNVLKLEDPELKKQNTVWINGLPYGVKGQGEDRYVEVSPDKDCFLVTYSFHAGDGKDVHTQYPTGMKAYRVSGGKITYIPELDNLLQYSGSSIRITGKKGIRMITSLTKTNKAALTGKGLDGYKLVEYGTVLCFASEVAGDGDLILGKPYARSNYAYKRGVADPVFASTGNLIQYTNVLVGFSNDQCKEDIAMRPYIILEDAAGSQFTLYGGTIYRSIGYIAYQNRNVFQPKTASYDYVWSIIHHVYGNKYDKDYKG